MKLRIKFKKQGAVRFIGHLDVMRYFQKVMRRAQVDIRYSEGFSPHQIMSFASPLSVGLISNGEYMDIEVNSIPSCEELLGRLREASVEGIQVVSVRKLPDTAKNAMSQVAAADYRIWYKEGCGPRGEELTRLWQRFLDFCGQDTIPITKSTKKGERTVDLAPLIYEAKLLERTELLPAFAANEKAAGPYVPEAAVFLKLAAGSAANVKPEQVLAAFFAAENLPYPEFELQAEREELYADEEPEGGHRFVSLEEYGEELP